MGIPLALPTNQAAVPSPTMMYAVGSGSIAYFLTARAPSACASVIKYGFSELSSELNKIASALGDTPVTLPGNSITAILIVNFISATSLASSNWSMADEPPTRMADAHLSSTFFAIDAAVFVAFQESIGG